MKVEIQRCRQYKLRENILPPKLLYLSKYFLMEVDNTDQS